MKSVSAGSRSRVASTKSVAVDVGDEPEGEVAVAVEAQRLVRHRRAEVGAADADVDDVADALPGVARPRAAPHRRREGGHAVEHRVHLGDDVLAVDDDRRRARRAQRHVQHRTLLGDVDLLAAEHGVDARAQPRLLGEREQQPQGLVGDAVLRVVEVEPRGGRGQALAAPGIAREEAAQVHVADGGVVRLQRLPRRAARERRDGYPGRLRWSRAHVVLARAASSNAGRSN